MSSLDRIYQIDQLLTSRKSVTRQELEERLGVSWATLKRDLAYMKDRLNAPIVFDRARGGYRFEAECRHIGPQYELPGLWFSAEEVHALLTMQHLLSNLDTGGLLGPHIKPLMARLGGILGTGDDSLDQVHKRIRIETVGARVFHLDHFQVIGSALIRRKRLVISYHARGTDETTEREVSPQRLIYYRDNWYLDAWCHLRHDLRAFSVDCIQLAELLDQKARDVSERRLDQILGAGYGIFSGDDVSWATLVFTPERARWVSAERWHPLQKGRMLEDGRYELKVPYSDDPELIMDILKYGSDCRVESPACLAEKVMTQLCTTLEQYREAIGDAARSGL